MSILGALTIFLAFTFAALAIDAGRLWAVRQDIQHAADMAALAAARHNGCGTTLAEAQERAATAATQFGIDPSKTDVTLTVARGTLGTAGAGGSQVQTFEPSAEPSDTTTAAQVVLKKTVPKSLLMGGFIGQNIELSATATAKGDTPQATLSVGTRFGITQKQADFLSQMFGGILGNSSLTLTPASLGNLTDAVVNLEALRIAAAAASIDELLDMRVTVAQLLQWISAGAININATGKTALDDIISASNSKGNLTVRVGDIINVKTPAPDGVATANINVLDLVTAGLQIANKDQLITLNANVAGITNVTVKLLGLPKIAIGPKGKDINGNWCTSAKMASLSLIAGIDTTKLPKLSLLGNTATVVGDVAIQLVAGGANGHLIDLMADASGGQAQMETLSTLISTSLSNNAGTGPARLALSVKLLGGLLPINVGVRLGLTLPAQESQGRTMTVNVPAPVRKNMPQRVDRGTNVGDALGTAIKNADLTLAADILGPTLDGVVNGLLKLLEPTLKAVINGVVTPLLTSVVVPLLEVLGIGGSGVSVELTDIVAPQPILKI
jgi:uncharacterized membrane protein